MKEFVYEVLDSTNDETFYVLGLFKTAEEAISEIKKEALKNQAISEYQEEFETISVHKRKFGWGDSDKIVFSIHRERVIDEVADEWVWKTTATKLER